MNDLILSDEQWVEIYSDLAVILAEEYGDGPLITEIAENGDERYTEASQDRFNSYCDEATSIMERIGFKRLNDEDEGDAQPMTPIGEQIGKLRKQRNYPAAKFIVEHERLHDQIQKNPGPGDELLSEIERANDEYKTTRDPCARCGIYSFEGNVPFDDEGEEIGDRYYCIDCIGSVSDQIEKWKEDQ